MDDIKYMNLLQFIKHLKLDLWTFYSTYNITYFIGFVLIIIFIYAYNKLTKIKSESILLIRNIGLQSTISYSAGYESSNFIPWSCIQDVVINEVVHFQKVLYVLIVLTNDYKRSGKGVVPLFQNTEPKLSELEQMYRSIRLILSNDSMTSGDSNKNAQEIKFTIVK